MTRLRGDTNSERSKEEDAFESTSAPMLAQEGNPVPALPSGDIEKLSVQKEALPSDKTDFPGDEGFGYGYVIVGCAFFMAMVTWGLNACKSAHLEITLH